MQIFFRFKKCLLRVCYILDEFDDDEYDFDDVDDADDLIQRDPVVKHTVKGPPVYEKQGMILDGQKKPEHTPVKEPEEEEEEELTPGTDIWLWYIEYLTK